MTQAYIEFAHSQAPAWSLLFETKLIETNRPTWYMEKINRLFRQVEDVILPILNDDRDEAATTAKVLWASLYGICALSITGKVDLVLNEHAQSLGQSLVDHYLAGKIAHKKTTLCT